MKELNRSYIVLAMVIFGLLSSCGNPNKTGRSSQVTVSGKVFNGTVKNAAVKIYTVDQERNRTLFAETTSNDSGEYSLNTARYDGPLLIEVTKKDDSTTIVCSAPQGCDFDRDEIPEVVFGQSYPYNITLSAVIDNLNVDRTVEVSALTHIAATYIDFIGYDQNYIAMTNSRVAKVFSITDIINNSAIDITNKELLMGVDALQISGLKYGYLNAGLMALSQQKTYGQFADMLNRLSSSYKLNGGEFYYNFSDYSYTNHVTIEEMTLATLSVLNSNLTESTAFDGSINDELVSMLAKAQLSAAGSLTHTVAEIGNFDIVTAKKLVGEVRRWSTQLAGLESASKQFGDRLNAAKKLSEASFLKVGKQMTAAMSAAVQAYKSNLQNSQLTYSLQDFLPNQYVNGSSGEIEIQGNVVFILNGIIEGSTVSLELSMPAQSGTQFEMAINKGTVQAQDAYINIDGGSAKVQFSKNVSNLYQDSISLPAVESAKLKMGVVLVYSDDIRPIEFEGELEAAVVNFNPKNLYLSGKFNIGEESFRAAFDANMSNAESFDSQKPLVIGSVRSDLVDYAFSNGGNSITFDYPDEKITDTYNSQIQRVIRTREIRNYGRTYTWEQVFQEKYVSLNDFLVHSYQALALRYLWVSGEGYYRIDRPETWNSNGGSLVGTLFLADNRDERQDSWRDVDGTLSLEAEIAGLPLASIGVTADRNSYNTIGLSSNIAYQNVDINLSLTFGDIDEFIDGDGSLKHIPIYEILNPYEINLVTTVTDPIENTVSRLSLVFDVNSGDSPGIVEVDGKLVGVIGSNNKTSAPIVTYVDGTFESIAF